MDRACQPESHEVAGYGDSGRGRFPPRFSPRGAARHRLAIGGKAADTVLAYRAARRQPRGLPLPPLRWDESLVLMKRMADIDTETRNSVVGLEIRYVCRSSKLEKYCHACACRHLRKQNK